MHKLSRCGKLNSYDLAKCTALISMIFDHTGLFFFPELSVLRIVGRISFPIFCFLIGYSQKFKNDRTIIILAILMLIFDYILDDKQNLLFITRCNILPTIIISRLILGLSINWVKNNLIIGFFLLTLYYLPINLFIQYGTLGCLFMIYGYLIKHEINHKKSKLFLGLTTITYIYLEKSNYTLIEIVILILLISCVSIWMNKFKLKTYQLKNNFVKQNLLLCSRYSLFIYYIHFELFKLLSKIYNLV